MRPSRILGTVAGLPTVRLFPAEPTVSYAVRTPEKYHRAKARVIAGYAQFNRGEFTRGEIGNYLLTGFKHSDLTEVLDDLVVEGKLTVRVVSGLTTYDHVSKVYSLVSEGGRS